MSDELRDLLNRVASGEISPEEAQARLTAEASAQPSQAPTTPQESPQSSTPPEPVRRVSIRTSAVRLTVVGDPTVDTAIADGPHRAEHVGDTLTIHSDLGAGQYEADVPRTAFATWIANVNRAGSHIRVRVNPDLPLEVLTVAGSLELSGMRSAVSVGVEAGSAKLTGGSGALRASVASGSLEAEWEFHGESTVSSDLGSTRITVLPGSDVSITAEATLGLASIRMPDGSLLKASAAGIPPVVVGAGAGRLTTSARLGSLVVSVP